MCLYIVCASDILHNKKNKLKKPTEMYIDNSLNQQVVQPYKIAGLPGYRALII